MSDACAVLYGELDSRGNFVIGIVNEQGAEIVSGFERTGFDAHGSFRGSVSVIEAVHVGVFAIFVDTYPVFRCTRTVLVVDENCFIGGEFRLVGRQRRYVFAYREINSFTRFEVLSQGEVIQEIISFGQIFRQSECAFGVSAEVIPRIGCIGCTGNFSPLIDADPVVLQTRCVGVGHHDVFTFFEFALFQTDLRFGTDIERDSFADFRISLIFK